MRTFPLLLCLQLAPLLGGCVISIDSCSNLNTVQGSGVSKAEVRQVPEFTRIQVDSSADVVAHVGGPTSLKVTTDDNLLPFMVTEVRDGTLVITTRSGSYSFRSGLKIEVATPSLLGVEIDGSSDVIVDGLAGPSFSATISGSGSIHASGATDQLAAEVDGSGDLRLFDLEAKNAKVDISGSGDAQITATEGLTASISGSGDIRYRGNPRLNGLSMSGSGTIQSTH
jgi:putative autotransporter adhesin-like protein